MPSEGEDSTQRNRTGDLLASGNRGFAHCTPTSGSGACRVVHFVRINLLVEVGGTDMQGTSRVKIASKSCVGGHDGYAKCPFEPEKKRVGGGGRHSLARQAFGNI